MEDYCLAVGSVVPQCRTILLWTVALSSVIASACGGGRETTGARATPYSDVLGCTEHGAATATATIHISIVNVGDPNVVGRYDPSPTTVKAGTTVEWSWEDGANKHSVTSDSGTFDSCLRSLGGKFPVTFQVAGPFPYHCSIHPGMKGILTVSQ
jgi:plastocyanin